MPSRARRGGAGSVSVASIHRWTAGTAINAAKGFTNQSTIAVVTVARASAHAGARPALSARSGSGRTTKRRASQNAIAHATAAAPQSTAIAGPSSGMSDGGTAAGGGSGVAPRSDISSAAASAATNGTHQTPSHRSQRATGSWRRRTRANASTVATSAGSSSVSASSASGQPGMTWLTAIT